MDDPFFGAAIFFGKAAAISHVAIALDRHQMIEAGGGDHTTTTAEAAAARGACVRLAPIARRADLVDMVKPVAIDIWPDDRRARFEAYMLGYAGGRAVPYLWAGNNPLVGFDCSGFALWCYRAFGLIGPGDLSSGQLREALTSAGGRRLRL